MKNLASFPLPEGEDNFKGQNERCYQHQPTNNQARGSVGTGILLSLHSCENRTNKKSSLVGNTNQKFCEPKKRAITAVVAIRANTTESQQTILIIDQITLIRAMTR